MARTPKNRIYIIGAGFAGTSIAAEIRAKGVVGEVVAFLDDDPAKLGRRIEGIPVLGPIADVVKIIHGTPADEAIIAIPSASRSRLKELYQLLERADFTKIRIVPSISQIVDGSAHLIQTREIDPQDLLGRTPVQIGLRESLRYLRGKRVLITGAGGTIGSELARQLLSGGAQRLYLFGHGENSIYEIDRELRILQEEGVGDRATIVPIIGELQDSEYMNFIMRRVRADVVFHAAAYKHVPMAEANPVCAVANNVFGTENLVEACEKSEVKRFVLISTDKIVEPRSIYGVTKSIAEDIVLSKNGDAARYMVVRFGNVLGSRGSVVPLFQRQIEKGGPVTVTDPRATRFFMTVPEAASLVLRAGGAGNGGRAYVLDMGEPVRIQDLAEQMIKFHGYEPGEQIRISYVGLRPGEKMSESLTTPFETAVKTELPRIHRIERETVDSAAVTSLLAELRPVCFFDREQPELYRNRRELRSRLAKYAPTLPVAEDEPEY